MEIWWNSMSLTQQAVWIIAVVASLIFIIQMIMTFVGMDSDADFSGNVDDISIEESTGMPFQLFTFRNFINFFLGFSWTYVIFCNTISSQFWLIVLSTFIGSFIVVCVMLIFYGLSKMVQSGNIFIEQTVGLTATVYLPVPANKEGKGKIQTNVQNCVREYDAVTDGEALKTGNMVKIIRIIEENTLLVEKI
jgi:hypothetical protein